MKSSVKITRKEIFTLLSSLFELDQGRYSVFYEDECHTKLNINDFGIRTVLR